MMNGSKSVWWSFAGCGKRGNENSQLNSTNDPNDEEEANIPLAETRLEESIGTVGVMEEDEGCKKGWCYRIFSFHYKVLHKMRWIILLSSMAAIGVCTYFTFQFKAPDDPDPPFLPQSNKYEIHRVWARRLLLSNMATGHLGEVFFIWGLTPADTGFHLNPDDVSEQVYDTAFDPRAEENQVYLRDVCNNMFDGNDRVLMRISCPMEEFDSWLMEQSQLSSPSEEYMNNCEGADSVPVPPNVFDSCMIAFGKLTDQFITYDEGRVRTLAIRGRSKTTFYSAFKDQAKEWDFLEAWSENEKLNAPEGANRFFQVSHDFWGYDTLDTMRQSTWKSAFLALACASAMILLTSHSVLIMIFAAISIAYVLVASSACLVGLGWTLGLFESILFSLLIGIGCDFVLHFGHAYTMFPGVVSKEQRTRRALFHMGPSVLGSAFTTISTAFIMLLTQNSFSRKFAMMLVMTIVHSVIGSFIIFLVLCDCFGPKSTCSNQNQEKQITSSSSSLACCKASFLGFFKRFGTDGRADLKDDDCSEEVMQALASPTAALI